MADQSSQNNRSERELVFCHQCENEWYRDEHGLICPQCECEFVEIIDADTDPRAERDAPLVPESTHPNFNSLFHNHNPWEGTPEDAPDPEEGDISRVQYTGPGGMSFTRVTYTSSGPRGGFTTIQGSNPMGSDPFSPILSRILGIPPNLQSQQGQTRGQQEPGPGNQGNQDNHGNQASQGNQEGSRLQEGPRMTGGPRVTGNVSFTTNFGNGSRTQNIPVDDIQGILASFLGPLRTGDFGPGGGMGLGPDFAGRAPGGPMHMQGSPFDFLTHFLNPANARSGDAVYTNEALDRIISQLMEQHGGSTAPGPAAEAAIGALPKIKITKEHQDKDGNAECSICMDPVSLGDEVMELPCKHWFHPDCVSSWLREHDTCPHCRRGITPKEGDGQTPRATGEAPRNWQIPDELRRTNSREMQGNGTASSPFQIPSSPEAGPSSSSPPRTRSSGAFSGITGWMGRFAGRRDNDDSGGNSGSNNNNSST